MPWGIYEVENVVLTFVLVAHLNSVRLDGNAALALEVHVVKGLGLHLAVRDGACGLEQAIC